ncbi:MAG: LysR family transcriptional regulator, partial [Myxococcota bacterium]
MTHEQLRMFLAVAEQGSFRSAARAVAKTQPSVSAAVRALEHEFDLELFDRSGYRPTLTVQGQTFYRRARAVAREFASLEALARQLATGV